MRDGGRFARSDGKSVAAASWLRPHLICGVGYAAQAGVPELLITATGHESRLLGSRYTSGVLTGAENHV